MRRNRAPVDHSRERGAALVVAILVLAILTVIGIALMLITSTESRIAANEWSVNRAFYGSDAGVRWASAEMHDPQPFMTRPEFAPPPPPFGTVLFQMSSHRNTASGFFTGNDIQVTVQKPEIVGRRYYSGSIINSGTNSASYVYTFEIRSNAAQSDALLQYAKALVADVDIGPLPAQLGF